MPEEIVHRDAESTLNDAPPTPFWEGGWGVPL
jgi:hypothetical protein